MERLIILAFLKRANRIDTSLAIRNCQKIINSLIFLLLQINLIRRRTPVLLQTYLPSGLFVVVSWISFIVPPEIVPGRKKQRAKQQQPNAARRYRLAMKAAKVQSHHTGIICFITFHLIGGHEPGHELTSELVLLCLSRRAAREVCARTDVAREGMMIIGWAREGPTCAKEGGRGRRCSLVCTWCTETERALLRLYFKGHG